MEYYVYWCKKNGERTTSSTKFLTFVGLREQKERIRYQYELQNGNGFTKRSGQSMAFIIGLDKSQKPDQNTYGVCISRFKSAIMSAQRLSYNDNTNDASHQNSNPFV